MTDSHDELQQYAPSGEAETRTKADARELAFIGATIGRMSERRRAVFCAVRFDDASYEEIGEKMGLTVREVEAEFAAAIRQIHHARRGRSPAAYWRRWRHRIAYRPRR